VHKTMQSKVVDARRPNCSAEGVQSGLDLQVALPSGFNADIWRCYPRSVCASFCAQHTWAFQAGRSPPRICWPSRAHACAIDHTELIVVDEPDVMPV
jgi:hypothetical protein